MRTNRGFSIIEIAIVLFISGALAAVAVPISSNSETKAKMSEADASLRNIRTQLRIYYGQNGEYPSMANGSYVIGSSWHNLASGSLAGKYFTDYSYTIESSPSAFTITCVTGDILPSNISMNVTGTLMGGI